MSWKEYFNELSLSDSDDFQKRLKVMHQANILFKTYTHFENFPNLDRKKIAGFYEKNDDID